MNKFKFIYLVVLLLVLTKCNKTSLRETIEISQSNNDFKSLLPNDDEYETMLNSLAISLSHLSKSKDVRTKVHSLVSKKFDGDDNTLIKHLAIEIPELSNLLAISKQKQDEKRILKDVKMKSKSNFNSFSDKSEFEKIVSGYKSGNYKWFPQIYIPFIENHLNNLNSIPTIGIVKDDEEIIPGYIHDENGNLVMIDIDHRYAKQNLTWIISVNERTNENGELLMKSIQDQKPILEQRAAQSLRIRIGRIELYSPHESWGRSEVSQISMHGLIGSCFHNGSVFNGENFLETNQMNHAFLLSESNGKTYLTTGNFTGSNLLQVGECFDFILFERDPQRNSTERIEKFNNCSNGSNMVFFSYSGPYFHAHTVNNNVTSPMCLTQDNGWLRSWVSAKQFNIPGEAYCDLFYAEP